ncbi:MAG: bifunctional 4-hydroxy-2-oxoglutarate aldolase/2-dehydro-3-deoxy-phosphogluconate aldolase [Chloroflexota bacterium]|nr:bifunctional 4-hydroxy-2-oxoglutarate aldolase/2-dehydro-3-deoxy-phosphogluconate aldolase [Chloroflexota bacterium]
MATNIEQTADHIKRDGIVAIIRGDYGEDAILQMGEALLEARIVLVEVTLNTRGALESIPKLRKQFGGSMVVGAGTVRTADQVKLALDAGAEFIVSPNFDAAAVARSMAHDILHLPGIATPTEAQQAVNVGCRMVKLFPIDALGGVAYLKALRAPLNDVDFLPTGGIGVENIAEYARAGAVAVGIGSSLVSKDWTVELLIERAAALRAAWDGAKAHVSG